MSQPTAYVPAHSFAADSATLANFPGQALDVEFADVKTTTDQIRNQLSLLQRDDSGLANGIVTYESLSTTLQSNGLAGASAWLTATAYLVGTPVYQNGSLYRCLVAHTSGVFATDLSAVKWLLLTALATGATGAAGTNGTNGTNGVNSGIPYTFDTSTTMSVPASGALRMNNGTLASVTAIAFNVLTADSGNPSAATTLLTFDDSTTLAHRGNILVRKVSAPQNFALFDITGAITDNTTWQQHTVTCLNSNGSFSASDAVTVTWLRTGDAGAGTISGATNHGVAIATGAASVTSTAVMTDGQLLVGQSAADPLPKTITGVITVAANGATAFADAGITALAAFNTNGLLAQTANDVFAGRTLTGTANHITVTNGDGVAGNPTLSVPSRPGFAAHKNSTDQTALTHAAYNGVTWPTTSDNVGSYFDTANSWWTPPAGYVSLKAAVWQTQNAASTGSPTFVLKILRFHSGVTISNASPGVITWPLHGLAANRPVQFTTTGALPTGLVALTVYYVKTVLDANTFTVSATIGGAAINTSSAGSGTHSGFCDVAAGVGTANTGAAGQAIAQVGHDYAYSNGTDHFITNFYTTSSTAANNGVIDGNPAHSHFSGNWLGP